MFTDKEHRGPFEFSDDLGNLSIGAEPANNVVPAHRVEANDKDLLLSTSEKEESRGAGSNGSAYTAPLFDTSSLSVAASQAQLESAISNPTVIDRTPQASFAIDDLLGLGLAAAPAPAPSPPPLKLNSKAVLDPGTFQQKWRQLPISVSQVYIMIMALLEFIFICFYNICFLVVLERKNLICCSFLERERERWLGNLALQLLKLSTILPSLFKFCHFLLMH